MNFSLREWKQYRKLTLLIEGRIDDARKAGPIINALSKLAKEAHQQESDFVDKVAQFDPSGSQKYLVWTIKAAEKNLRNSMSDRILDAILEYAETGHEGIDPENITSIQRAASEDWDKVWWTLITRFGFFKDVITDFHKFVQRKIIRGGESDINAYEDFSAVDSRNEEAREELEEKAKQKRLRKSIDVIHADDDWFIFEPLTYEASCHYAQRHGEGGTRWCVSSDDYPQYYTAYLESGNQFVFVFNSKGRKFNIQNNDWEENQAVAGHDAMAGTTVWDEDDDPMSYERFTQESGIPSELEEKIADHYSEKHGLEIQPEMGGGKSLMEFELMQNFLGRLNDEEESAAFADLSIDIYHDEDENHTTISSVSFSLPLPRELFKHVPESFTEFENEDVEEAIRDIVDKFGIDPQGGTVEDVGIGDIDDQFVKIGISWSPDNNYSEEASEFFDWVHGITSGLNSYVVYDPAVVAGLAGLPDMVSSIMFAFAYHTPEDVVTFEENIPRYEHFHLDFEGWGPNNVEAVSERISLGTEKYSLDTSYKLQAEFDPVFFNWLGEKIDDVGKQKELPLSEASRDLSRTAKSIKRYTAVNIRWDGPEMWMHIAVGIPVFPSSKIWNEQLRVLAVEILDESWDTVRQMAARAFYNAIESRKKELTEVKKKRKIRIRFK